MILLRRSKAVLLALGLTGSARLAVQALGIETD